MEPVANGTKVKYHGTYGSEAENRVYTVRASGEELYPDFEHKSTDGYRYMIYDEDAHYGDHYGFLRNVRRQSFEVVEE